MGRPVVLSNGELFVGLDEHGLVHDFYFPYIGQDNLTNARSLPHKIGVWVDGSFSWLDDGSWDIKVDYQEDTLISDVRAEHSGLQIGLEMHDCVDASNNAFVRSIQVHNLSDQDREVRVFMHQIFQISMDGREDTAFYEPEENYIFDYKGKTCLTIFARTEDGPFKRFAVGNYGIEGKTGTFLDAEDGELSGNLVEHGGVDSVVGLDLNIGAGEIRGIEYWIAAGTSQQECEYVHAQLKEETVIKRINTTRQYQLNWLKTAQPKIGDLPDSVQKDIHRSLLVVKAHIDNRGSILASGDSSIYNYGRDYYAYCWPRDGAYAVWPLIKLGYTYEAKVFFDFCERVAHRDGYLQHKFQPDGAIGSTWHPQVQDHHKELAIQEDETALVLWMLAEYVEHNDDKEYFKNKYECFIKPAAEFMANFVDQETGLCHGSYDLWEQKFLTNSYTVFLTSSTLKRISKLALDIMDDKDAERWVGVAETLDSNSHKLFDKDAGHYIKGLLLKRDGSIHYDKTLDISSLYGAMIFGQELPLEHMAATADAAEQQLVHKGTLGVIRYPGDDYMRTDNSSPGNPWYLCTFWLAQYYFRTGRIEDAAHHVQWCRQHVSECGGIMSEQINPANGSPVGVAPLVWSHAEYINTLLLFNRVTK